MPSDDESFEAKDAGEAVARGEALPESKPVDAETEDQILSLLEAGRKIVAIKLYRRQTGASLKDAKDLVEAFAAKHGISLKGAGCAGMVLLMVMISAVIVVGMWGFRG